MAVYSIKPIGSEVEPIYVKAKTKQQALAHVAQQTFDVDVLRVSQIIDLAVNGKKIVQASVSEEPDNVD